MFGTDDLRAFAVPVDGRPHRLSVGTRPVAPECWLLPGSDREAQLAIKRRLLAERRTDVLAALPGSEAACLEVYELVSAAVEWRGQRLQTVGQSATARAEQALALASLQVQEDLCIMAPRAGEWLLVAASLSFPSRWRLADKLGASLDGIHAPVPGYPDRLSRATGDLFGRLADRAREAAGSGSGDGSGTEVLGRFNWTLTTEEDLYTPEPPPRQVVLAVAEVPDRVWLRVERQTLRCLPGSGAVLFTIRTFLTPLGELDAVERVALAGSLRGVSDELIRYRGWVGYVGAVVEWLSGGEVH
ncbi:MAG: hypothetical protein QG671_71 [Actinomycetota bacterium]|nr:hypothetical protein [Actinomycetota bacterium]